MDDFKLFGKTESQLDTLLNTVHIFSQYIKMEFGISKCGILLTKRGKLAKIDGITIPTGEKIEEIDKDIGYKYLRILEVDDIKSSEIKSNIKKEYLRRLKLILKLSLNRSNTISAISLASNFSHKVLCWNSQLEC